MAMPAAQGLFHRAIIECGSLLRVNTADAATTAARAVLHTLGLDETQLDKLHAVPASTLEEAGRTLSFGQMRPVVDGQTLLNQPWDPSAPAISATVPLIVGTCQDEARWLFGSRDAALFSLDEAHLRGHLAQVRSLPAESVDTALAVYRAAYPTATPSDLFFLIASDLQFRRSAIAQAERKTQQGAAPAFMFYFTYATPILDELLVEPQAGQTVVDLAYGQGETALVTAALAAGCVVIDGREALVRQGAASFRLWTGLEPPVEAMRAAVGI